MVWIRKKLKSSLTSCQSSETGVKPVGGKMKPTYEFGKLLSTFIAENQITMKCERTDRNPLMGKEMDHWKCRLTFDGRRMTTLFSMGYGHNGAAPTIVDVLDCLASDSASITEDFEEWASGLGYDPDSRKAEKIYKACQVQAQKLEKFLGPDLYQELLYHVERE